MIEIIKNGTNKGLPMRNKKSIVSLKFLSKTNCRRCSFESHDYYYFLFGFEFIIFILSMPFSLVSKVRDVNILFWVEIGGVNILLEINN